MDSLKFSFFVFFCVNPNMSNNWKPLLDEIVEIAQVIETQKICSGTMGRSCIVIKERKEDILGFVRHIRCLLHKLLHSGDNFFFSTKLSKHAFVVTLIKHTIYLFIFGPGSVIFQGAHCKVLITVQILETF